MAPFAARKSRIFFLALLALVTGCGSAKSKGFLSDHNVCNADLTALSSGEPLAEALTPVTPADVDALPTFGQKMALFPKTVDAWGVAVRLKTGTVPAGDTKLEIWAKLDRELAYGQATSTVTPDGQQGVVQASAVILAEQLGTDGAAWINVQLDQVSSFFVSGRYWLMLKPNIAEAAYTSTTPGVGLATKDVGTGIWAISTTVAVPYQVIPCF